MNSLDIATRLIIENMVKITINSLETIEKGLVHGELSPEDIDNLYENGVKASSLREEGTAHILEYIARMRPIGKELKIFTMSLNILYDLYRINRYCWEIGRIFKVVRNIIIEEKLIELIREVSKMIKTLTSELIELNVSSNTINKVIQLEKDSDDMYLERLQEKMNKPIIQPVELAELLIARHIERIFDHVEYIVKYAEIYG